MLFSCLNLLPPSGFERRIYDLLEYIESGSRTFNDLPASVMKKEKTGYGSVSKAFSLLNGLYTLDELGENSTGIKSRFYSMGRICDIRSPYFMVTVFGDGMIKIFNPRYQGNIRSLNGADIVDMRRNMFSDTAAAYYNNVWSETSLSADAWSCLDSIIVFRGTYEYSFGQNVSYQGINYFVVAREYNGELEDIVNYAVKIPSGSPKYAPASPFVGLGAGIIRQEEDSVQGHLTFSNGLRINYIKNLAASGKIGDGFSAAYWTFPEPFTQMYFSGSAIPIAGVGSWHQCMISLVAQNNNDYKTSCKIVCRGRTEDTWITRYIASVIGI